MKSSRLLSSLMIAALLSGCSLIPDFARPSVDTPAGWTEGAAATDAKVAQDWWKSFNSAELNAMMEEALSANNDLGAALYRVEQSRATLRTSRSTLFPSVNATSRTGYDRSHPDGERKTSENSLNAGLGIAYELDLFGSNRAEIESSSAALKASEFDKDATALIIMGDVAKGYFNVLNLQERLKIADQNLDSSRELLRIVQARFDAGATTMLDVSQQKADLAANEASRASTAQQLEIAKTSLAVLLGKPPQRLAVQATDTQKITVPTIAAGQPSTLLERRPDIRRSEADLISANADIGVARAAFFPSLTLGVDGGLISSSIGDPVSTTLAVAGNLAAPLFTGGLLEGNLQLTKARKLELVENYRKTILVSFKEVEDALNAVKTSQQREQSLLTALTEARKAYDLSTQQYDVGSIDFQTLLDARQTMLAVEDSYIQTKNDRLAAAVDLYKSLGGGWAENMPVDTLKAREAAAKENVAKSATQTNKEAARPVATPPAVVAPVATPAPTATTAPATGASALAPPVIGTGQ